MFGANLAASVISILGSDDKLLHISTQRQKLTFQKLWSLSKHCMHEYNIVGEFYQLLTICDMVDILNFVESGTLLTMNDIKRQILFG